MNRCGRRGYLVDTTSMLPTDPTDYFVEGLPVVGCSRLRCDGCGVDVRNVPGLGFRTKQDPSSDQFAALYATAELSNSSLLEPTHPQYRLYLCKCSRWLEASQHACEEPDPDPFRDPDMSWRCTGHPTIALPHDLEGVQLTSLEDLRDLAVRGFHGFVPPRTRPNDAERGNWIARLRARIDAAGQRVVDDVAIATLEWSAPKERALAVMYVYSTGSEPAARRVFELLAGDRELFTGVPDDVTPNIADKTLVESMWRALRSLIAIDKQVCDAARAEAMSGRAGRSVYAALARVDTDWFIANCADLARAAGPNLELLDRSLAQLPPGLPRDAIRQRIRAAAKERT